MLADQLSVYYKQSVASQENLLETKPVTRKPILPNILQGITVLGIIIALVVITILVNNGRARVSGQNLSVQSDAHSSSSSKLMLTNYAGQLTGKSSTYNRVDNNLFYYEVIKFTVPISGDYSFKSISADDMYGYLYKTSFNPFRANDNYLQHDDDSGGSGQFLIQYTLEANSIYILLVTTSSPRVLTTFSILAQGPAKVKFLFTSVTKAIPPASSMIPIDGSVIYGIYDAAAGGNSLAATPGSNTGGYPANQSPNNAIDSILATKYLNFGACSSGDFAERCGTNTGFYLTLRRGATTVTGFRLCTAEDRENRDPITVTLEGSNQPIWKLTDGKSWNLVYNGDSGLTDIRGRNTCGSIQYFSNSVQYTSYRFLVTNKRGIDNSVQYAEIQFFGI